MGLLNGLGLLLLFLLSRLEELAEGLGLDRLSSSRWRWQWHFVLFRRPELDFAQFDRLGLLRRFGPERLDCRLQLLLDILSHWSNRVVAHVLDEVRECLGYVHRLWMVVFTLHNPISRRKRSQIQGESAATTTLSSCSPLDSATNPRQTLESEFGCASPGERHLPFSKARGRRK